MKYASRTTDRTFFLVGCHVKFYVEMTGAKCEEFDDAYWTLIRVRSQRSGPRSEQKLWGGSDLMGTTPRRWPGES